MRVLIYRFIFAHMKLPLKYIAVLVTVSLAAIFAYQAYWLMSMYTTMTEQTSVAMMNAIRNADHVELFMRVDSIGVHDNEEEQQADTLTARGEISFSASFKSKDEKATMTRKLVSDSINIDEQNHIEPVKEDTAATSIGNYFMTIENMTKSLQQGLHALIDSAVVSINVVKFDSILTAELARSNLHMEHYIDIMCLSKDSMLASTFAPGADKTELQLYEYEYNAEGRYVYRVYTQPVGGLVIRQMTGILLASFIILVILGFSFWYLIRVLLKQKTLEEMKTDFTNNITHELKTPIAVAYAATDALLNFNQADEKSKRDKYLSIAQEQLQRLSGLVEQILSMSMEKRETFKLKPEEVELAPLINALTEQHTLKADGKVKFEVQVTPPTLTLMADRTHLSNIISNLMDNAVKYSPRNPVVKISCQARENRTTIAVTDNGMGIQPDKQRHIFDKFYRVPHGNLHNVKGYGLGLCYVKTMTEKMHGTIELKSEPGKGSTFTLIFNEEV